MARPAASAGTTTLHRGRSSWGQRSLSLPAHLAVVWAGGTGLTGLTVTELAGFVEVARSTIVGAGGVRQGALAAPVRKVATALIVSVLGCRAVSMLLRNVQNEAETYEGRQHGCECFG